MSSRKAKMRKDLVSLHREMEVATKRKISRKEQMVRTQKRKKLEREESHESELLVDNDRSRLRGSKAAIQDKVVQGSLIFQQPPSRRKTRDEDENQDESEEEYDIPGEEEEDDDEEEEDVDEAEAQDDGGDEAEGEDQTVASVGGKVGAAKPKASSKGRIRRRRYRLKNFQSVRMAQRHGDALKFHASGQPKLAIEALKKVAQDAPSAPQVYSSLGMVYEDMFRESLKRSQQRTSSPPENETPDNQDDANAIQEDETIIPDADLAEQLDLAKKAYGSYHIAAILCKRDYSLWVKAADFAIDTAEIHGKATVLPNLSKNIREYHRSEKKRWYMEALGDMKCADNLKPPGIEVPAKLAATSMELGKLSEALTILTDLKNRQAPNDACSEFQSSHKAWLLYADLMLRIGHECMQWNRGVRTNENYMFRRWLRKLSKTFDWQERRLQALSLALEAAAGSKSTAKFKTWMLRRAMSSTSAKDYDENGDDDTAQAAQEKNDTNDPGVRAAQFEEEKKILLEKNRRELEAFDRTTTEMNLVDAEIAGKDREYSRSSMLKSQEEAIATLEKEYNQDTGENTNLEEGDKIVGVQGETLPISASCRQVCDIASELMKHLHGLELFEGARLVGEVVSNYFKERALRFDKRSLSRKRYNDLQERLAKSPLLLEPYDENFENDIEDDDESGFFLSDDEDLDNNENQNLLDSLRSGQLPPELRVLLGFALIGEGGANYVAAKCIEKIEDLPQEDVAWLRDGEHETNLAGDPVWIIFRRAMTENLGRTAAYAFLADILRKTDKEKDWSNHFAPTFRRHCETLESVGLVEELLKLNTDEVTPFINFRKNQLLKIIMATTRFEVDLILSPTSRVAIYPQSTVPSETENTKVALSCMKSLTRVLHVLWKVEKGSISTILQDVIKVCTKWIQFFVNKPTDQFSYSVLNQVFMQSRVIISLLCKHQVTDGQPSNEKIAEKEWGEFPIHLEQSSECRAISVATYNLAVGCNVSLFSGWEKEEFTLKLLKRQFGNRHFGVHIHGRRMAGLLSATQEEEMSYQWSELETLMPSFPVLRFQERIAEVKEKDWYKKEIEDRKQNLDDQQIAKFAEEDGLSFYLAFSRLCIHLAKAESNAKVSNGFLQLCLSVLLPISQFCIDDTLWRSDIGEAAGTVKDFDEWRVNSEITTDITSGTEDRNRVVYRKRKKEERVVEKKVQEWVKGTDKPAIRTFVSLPTSELRTAWNADSPSPNPTAEEKEHGRQAMQSVHNATLQLRSCYTEMATERASLNLAVALLELASQPTCYDPFACLQQAAMFASQGSKAGNSDISFRQPLPDMKSLTPREALTILGRADCLQSLYFTNEAAFLCSYVARVCRLHRDQSELEYEWTNQWQILAVLAFNVSVLIRTTVSTVLDKNMQKSFLSIWGRDVVEELEKARLEGWAWKRKYTQENGASNNGFAADEDSDVDESDAGGDNVGEGEVEGENHDNDYLEMEDSKLPALQADSSDEDLMKDVEVVAI